MQLSKHSAPSLIIGVYRPPSSKPDWYIHFKELILAASKVAPIVIMGDLNSDLTRPTVYPGRALVESIKLAGAQVPSYEPTRISSTAATCLDMLHSARL
mgnify:CR=1 FL=1